jgi:thioredoxin 1
MKAPAKIAVVLGVVVAAAAAVILKNSKSPASANPSTPAAAAVSTATGAKLPKLLDLGAGKCIPCKAMAPILEELKKEYEGRLIVEFIDVWQNEDAGKQYGVDIIPTQIFYNADGKELFRHTGFFGKEDILAKWKELGVDLSGGKPSTAIVREVPVAADTRPPDSVCFMCDGTITPPLDS